MEFVKHRLMIYILWVAAGELAERNWNYFGAGHSAFGYDSAGERTDEYLELLGRGARPVGEGQVDNIFIAIHGRN